MKKLKNVKVFEINENKFDKFIFGIIESNESGDWNEYEEGEQIVYNCDVRDEEWIDLDFKFLDNPAFNIQETNDGKIWAAKNLKKASWIMPTGDIVEFNGNIRYGR